MPINAQFPEKLAPLFDDSLRYVGLKGGRGGAKSHGVAASQLIRGLKRPMLFLDAREIQKSIADSVHALLQKKIRDLDLQHEYKVLDTEIRGRNGTKFIFAGLRHNIDNIKSIEDVDECWIEEAQTTSQVTWDKLPPTIRKEVTPCCYYPPGIGDGQTKPCSKCGAKIPLKDIIPSRIVATWNPELEDDPTDQYLVVNPKPRSAVIHMTYRDNPWFTGVLHEEMEEMKTRNYQKYLHIYEGQYKQAVEGAIYSEYLERAKAENRVGSFPYDDRYPVSCYWDLGYNDNTSIVFVQFVNHEPRIIDAYQNQFQKTPHYIQTLHGKQYVYDRIVLPHDSTHNHAEAEKTWLQQVREAFPNAMVYAGEKRPVELRLEAAKNIFDRLKFHREGTADLFAALARYHFAIDPNTGRQSREPFHGPESNYADAFGYMALELQPPRQKAKPKPQLPSGGWAGKLSGVR